MTAYVLRWVKATRRPGSRCHAVLVVALSSLLVASALMRMDETGAGAAVSTYQRISRTFPGTNNANVSLRTRGYIDDSCVVHATIACRTQSSPWKFRAEATAQSLAIWTLASMPGRNDVPAYNTVDWEVGPSPDTPYASLQPLREPPGEPDDPCDPERPGFVKPGRWRIDIVADQRSILEVKRWHGDPATRDEVTNQLTCYQQRAREPMAQGGGGDVQFVPNSELNSVGWATPFVELSPFAFATEIWCVWAPIEPGHIYVAPMTEAPPDAQQRCGGTALQSSSVLLKFLSAAAALGISIDYTKRKTAPAVIPAYQRTTGFSANYSFSVIQDPSLSRYLSVDFGDGSSSTFFVPRGSGVTSVTASHTFPSPGRFRQSGFIFESAALGPQAPASPDAVQQSDDLTFEAVTDVGSAACCSITQTEIDKLWEDLGGVGGVLGDLTSNTNSTACGGGLYNDFQGGAITWSPSAGAHATYGAIRNKWQSMGFECSVLGLPIEDQRATIVRPGLVQVFEGGYIYSSSAGTYSMSGAIKAKYDAMGNQAGFLGMPISDEFDSYGPPPGGFVGEPTNGRLQYFQGSNIFWNRFSGETIAYGEGGGITGNYYSNYDYSRVALRRPDANVDYDWGAGSPSPVVSSDRFLVQWRGRIRIPVSGDYTFYTLSDDGVGLDVCPDPQGYGCGNQRIIDNWTDHPPTENASSPIFLEAGTHEFFLEFYENCCGATVRLSWSGPGFGKQIVPAVYLDTSYWGQAARSATGGSGAAKSSPAPAATDADAGAPGAGLRPPGQR